MIAYLFSVAWISSRSYKAYHLQKVKKTYIIITNDIIDLISSVYFLTDPKEDFIKWLQNKFEDATMGKAEQKERFEKMIQNVKGKEWKEIAAWRMGHCKNICFDLKEPLEKGGPVFIAVPASRPREIFIKIQELKSNFFSLFCHITFAL